MANGRGLGASREFRAVFEGGAISGLSDGELLGRFVAGRDEAAFSGLMARHGPMVRAVCRRWLPDPADEGDAFQATFLVLARKAPSVRVGDSLAPWLLGVSVRVARRARTLADRRRRREVSNIPLPDRPARDPKGEDDRLAIDEALGRLPSAYRAAITLCYLEGLTHEEAADRLSCPVGTVRSRLARGRDLLRSRLDRATSAPALIASLAAPEARAAVPDRWIIETTRLAAAIASARVPAGVVPARIASLVTEVSRIMNLSKFAKTAALSSAALLALAGAFALAAPRPEPGPPPAATAEVEMPPEPAAGDESPFEAFPAFVVKSVPEAGDPEVDPGLTEIRVTFSRKMTDQSWSWTQIGKETFPETAGKPHYEKDMRTCVLPVKLEPGKAYAIFVNSPRFVNFKDATGKSAVPYFLAFRTKPPI